MAQFKSGVFGKRMTADGATIGDVGNSDMKQKFKKGIAMVSMLTKVGNAMKPKKQDVIFSDTGADGDEDFVPEARRRFTFDDMVLKRGGKLTELFQEEQPPEEDFNDIVDMDDKHVEDFTSKELVGSMVESTYFRIFIFALIVINSILIGLQTDEGLSVKYQLQFYIFDQLVMSTFVCEILLKWYYGFWIFWKVGWNVLDFFIIVALLLGPELSFLSTSRILRILRVLRAFRSLRSVSATAGLSMVVQTILQSVPDMANISLLLSILLLMFGVAGVTLFGDSIPDKFGDLQSAMFSLFICTTQDGWVSIFSKFKEKGGLLHIGGAMYFFASIMVGAFVFANLVVAVVVTNLEMALKELRAEAAAEVDLLGSMTDPDHEDGMDKEQVEKVPVVQFEDIKGVDMKKQAPLQYADLKFLSAEKLEKYFLVLNAIEENLTEYNQIKGDIQKMYDVVSDLNIIDDLDDGDQLGRQSARPSEEAMAQAPLIDTAELMRGDILSNLMKMEAEDKVSSKYARNMEDVIRSAARGPNLLDARFPPQRKTSIRDFQPPV